jgi:hypothetical protein
LIYFVAISSLHVFLRFIQSSTLCAYESLLDPVSPQLLMPSATSTPTRPSSITGFNKQLTLSRSSSLIAPSQFWKPLVQR